MGNLNVKIVNKSNHRLPEYKTPGSAGMDLKADILEPIVISPYETCVVPTGLFVELPQGTELQVRSRSGLAAKSNIFVLNGPGTIDSDYRGEIMVILGNFSKNPFVINPGDRIAQAVIARYEKIDWTEVSVLDSTERGENGLGSTGI